MRLELKGVKANKKVKKKKYASEESLFIRVWVLWLPTRLTLVYPDALYRMRYIVLWNFNFWHGSKNDGTKHVYASWLLNLQCILIESEIIKSMNQLMGSRLILKFVASAGGEPAVPRLSRRK